MFELTILWGFEDSDLDPKYWNRINAASNEVQLISSKEEIIDILPNTEALLVSLGKVVDREIIDLAPRLKYISVFGTDLSRINMSYATEKGITVSNVAGYSTEAVAEYSIALALDHYREIFEVRLQAENKNYSNENFLGREIKDKTWGVLGLGKIGGRTAALAMAFGAQLLYYDIEAKADWSKRRARYADLDDLLPQADIISLNLPLTTHTEGIITSRHIDLIKEGCLFLIMAPVELLDLDAVIRRCNKREIHIALNHSYELSKGQIQKLENCDQCLMLPPISYLTKESREIRQDQFVSSFEKAV